jgi:hypothetical protein
MGSAGPAGRDATIGGQGGGGPSAADARGRGGEGERGGREEGDETILSFLAVLFISVPIMAQERSV